MIIISLSPDILSMYHMLVVSGAESTLNVGGVFQHFSQFFGNFRMRKWGCNKIWCSHKIRVVTKSVLSQNTVHSINSS